MAREILRYFVRNPRAADSLEGVARWRLLDERIHSSLEQVARAIASLVAEGLLVSETTTSATSVFHLNERERAKIDRFLESVKSDDKSASDKNPGKRSQ